MNEIKYLEIHPEIKKGLADKRPIVALESTIIAHGMPYPKNVQTALEVEKIIRDNGALPATIAILEGKLCVGLSEAQLEDLGNSKNVYKVSLRDMPFVLANKISGATTVASTMRIAAMAGIKFFVTGGIGGVHRGAELSMDISADLFEMTHTSVAVISAGIKSILDIRLTLEFLETNGVPVVTFGQEALPGFYSRDSGFKSPFRMDDPLSIANMIKIKWDLGLNGAVLIANPVPAKNEVPSSEMETFINDALLEAKKKKISGKDITPFLLKTISEKTGGESLDANIALIKNNALLGALVACAYDS